MRAGIDVNKHTRVCRVCSKVYYDDTAVCSGCKTIENIEHWGNRFYDEEAIALEVVGEYPYHYKYWEEYRKHVINSK